LEPFFVNISSMLWSTQICVAKKGRGRQAAGSIYLALALPYYQTFSQLGR
jgi:hypothetical protein